MAKVGWTSRSLVRPALPSLKLVSLLLLIAVCFGAAPQTKNMAENTQKRLSEEAKKRIAAKLKEADSSSILEFDMCGDFKSTVKTLARNDLAFYNSLDSFITKNPIDNCKNPVPSPPCVICDDGIVLCSRANFATAKKDMPNLK